MDPFAMALDALFNAPGSMAAVYTPVGGVPTAVRTIRSQPDRIERFADFQIDVRMETFELRRSEVARPAIGGVIDIADERFAITVEPQIDVEGMSWVVLAEPTT